MDLSGGRESGNIDDRRGSGGRGVLVGGGLGTVVIALIAMFLGKNPGEILNRGGAGQQSGPRTEESMQAEEPARKLASVVLAETEDVWNGIFRQMGRTYQEPGMVLFTDAVQSGCGGASSQMGPFYCPADNKVYLDLSFFNELSQRFNAEGDFANAYVIAHEVGHHVQNLLGTSDKVRQMQQQTDEKGANRLSVMLELQADFYAGVWARNSTRLKINEEDIREALGAAAAIGDDRLQEQSQGRVVPDAFTHGTSEQRMYWFKKGWETGDVKQGDTFGSEL